MQAIIMAAGRGNRLAGFNPDGRPKCLLDFEGKSLLARQLDCLFRQGIKQATLVVGYEADLILEHVATLDSRPEVAYVYNPAYSNGSALSLLAAQKVLMANEPVLLLDADLLFHPRVMKTLIESKHPNCMLIDHDSKPDDEAMKIALDHGRIVEFRNTLKDGLVFDTLGESLGFFKFQGDMAHEIAEACETCRSDGLLDAPYEEILRDVLLKHPDEFGCEDVSGMPWLNLDLPQHLELAIKEVLPAIKKDID